MYYVLYIMLYSNDNTVLIWRTDTWEVEARLHKPLLNSPDVCMYKRVSWCPDGGSLCISG